MKDEAGACDPISDAVLARYLERTLRSREAMVRAARVMPGGNTRTTTFHPPYPQVFASGAGATLTDADGNRQIDLFQNGLSLIHGHAHPALVALAGEVMAGGSAWSGASERQIAYAAYLLERLGVDGTVRFANTGSEAGMLAVKLVRARTGRPLILKFRHAYHGSYPDLEAGLYGAGDVEGRAVIAEFDDIASVEAALVRHEGRIAAVMIEPVLFTGRVSAPEEGFLAEVERLARAVGAMTILDDCLMLRLAPGGSTERFGLAPDLIVLGKFAGGGTPLGAVIGRGDTLGSLDPTRPGALFHGGSFNGNVLGCALGHAALEMLDAPAIAALDAAAETIERMVSVHAQAHSMDVSITRAGSVCGIAFPGDIVRHEDDPAAMGLSAIFHLAAANEGVLLGPGGLIGTSTALDPEMARTAAAALCRAFDTLAPLIQRQ